MGGHVLILETYNEFQLYEDSKGRFLAIDETNKAKYSGFNTLEALKDFLDTSDTCDYCQVLTDDLNDESMCPNCIRSHELMWFAKVYGRNADMSYITRETYEAFNEARTHTPCTISRRRDMCDIQNLKM